MADKAGATGTGTTRKPPPPKGDPGAVFDEKPHLSEAEFREANYRRLMAEHRQHDAEIARIDSGRKAITDKRTIVRSKMTQVGYSLDNVDRILKDSAKRNRREQQGREDEYAWMREIEGLPVARTGEQLDLYEALPPTAKDEIEADRDGYNAGIIDLECKPPADLAPILHQTWMKAWHNGQERRKWALAAENNVERDPEKAGAIGVGSQVVKEDEVDDDAPATAGEAIARHFAGSEGEEGCETCGKGGVKLAKDVNTCPDCAAEYEPTEPAAVH